VGGVALELLQEDTLGRDLGHRLPVEPMPAYLRDHAVYYAGPAKTPTGYASGSFGPTTAGRMDAYVDQFQKAGGSMSCWPKATAR